MINPRCISALLFILFHHSFCIAQNASSLINVPVTARYAANKKSKPHNYRLQLLPQGDSVMITGIGFQHLTHALRKFRFANTGTRVNRSTLEQEVTQSLDSTYRALGRAKTSLTYKIPGSIEYQKGKQRFVKGGRASAYFTHQWVKLAKIPNTAGSALLLTTKGRFRTHHHYGFDYLPGAIAGALPALDPWHCEPANIQLFKLRKLQGYGLDKIIYKPYQESVRIIIRPSFEVYYPHNEVQPDAAGIQKVITYLEENNYVILNAMLEGGCSIEGDSLRNRYLQQQRALVLQRALHQYSDELVKKDTVTLTAPVAQFRILIANTDFAHLDTLSDELLIEKINNDDLLRSKLEPILALQRKASLKLVVAKRLTRDEQFEKFRRDLIRAAEKITSQGPVLAQEEAVVMGMIEKAWNYYLDGYLDHSQLSELLREVPFPDYIAALLTFHHLKQYENKSWPDHHKITWKEYWERHRLHSYMEEARTLLIRQRDYHRHSAKKYFGLLVDLQAYTYEFIEQGLLPLHVLCEIPYPETAVYMPLILNQYAYLFEKARILREEGSMEEVFCVPRISKRNFNRDSTINTDRFIDDLQLELGLDRTPPLTLSGQKVVVKKNFDDRPKGAYYFLLKQHYVKGNTQILKNVTTDDDKDAAFSVFNLWHFLDITISEWDPVKNHFYDEEVQIDQLEPLVARMKKLDSRLCRPQVNSLYLQYHLKMLYYLERFHEPGNPAHARYADTSLKYIADYYKGRAASINAKLSRHITHQLNLFNWLPGQRAGAVYGYDILNAIAKIRILSPEELKLYAHYLKLYNPAFNKVSPVYNRTELTALGSEPF